LNLFSIVFEAKLLFCAYPYFSLKNLFFDLSLKSISAKLVPIFIQATAVLGKALLACPFGACVLVRYGGHGKRRVVRLHSQGFIHYYLLLTIQFILSNITLKLVIS